MKSNRLFLMSSASQIILLRKRHQLCFYEFLKQLSQTLNRRILLMQHFWALCVHVHNKTSNVYLESKQCLF